ncbi:MAG: hypothetical protein ACREJX_14800, partial [Polyangiaceae bacterium]
MHAGDAIELARDVRENVGSAEWLERTGGSLTSAERAYLLRGMFGMIAEGFRLRRAAKRSARHRGALDAFDPPDTPIVRASKARLEATSGRAMLNHCHRTAFWTLVVLDQQEDELDPRVVETTWVAALLHDIGLDAPPERGDFSAGGIGVLKELAHEHGFSDEQTHDAAEAIAANLSTRVPAARFGSVAWAMNAGGAGELGIWPHRAQMHSARIAELERRYPRADFRAAAMRLIR